MVMIARFGPEYEAEDDDYLTNYLATLLTVFNFAASVGRSGTIGAVASAMGPSVFL